MATAGKDDAPHHTAVYRRRTLSSGHDAQGVAHKMASHHIGHINPGQKMDANVMDKKRKGHGAYEYLCHLEEAKKVD
jgi:hypothetical protein